MPLPTIQRRDTLNQTSWASGMITSLPAEELPDDAAVLIENFEFDDVGNLSTRLSPTTLVDTNGDPIVGIFTANFSGGTSKILYITSASPSPDLYWMDTDGTNISLLNNNLTATPQERVTWLMFNDVVVIIIGTPGGSSAIYTVNSSGTVTNITSTSSAPASNCGVVWNNRLWVAGNSSNPNMLTGSAINSETDWTVDDDSGAVEITVGGNDGDRISALSVFRGNLFVYKYNRIYVVSAISAPATIPSNLRVDLYTDKFGCVQKHTIQNLIDDQVFLSNAGIASLALAPLGEIRGVILSNNILELSQIDFTSFGTSNSVSSSCYSLNVQKLQQYWIAVPSGVGNGTDTVWVMDYSDIAKKDQNGLPLVRWCKFTGNMFGRAYATLGKSSETYLIVSTSATDTVLLYDPINNNTTFTGTHTRRVITRAFGNSRVRSLWYHFCHTITKLTTNVAYDINYYFDNYLTAKAGGYSLSLTGTPANNNRTIWKGFRKNDSGRKANLVQLEIIANTTDQGFTLKGVEMDQTRLNRKRSNTTWVSD